MVSPAVGSSHDPSDVHISDVTAPRSDMVNEVPVLGARVHRRVLVHLRQLEECVSDGQAMFSTESEKQLAV